MEELARKVKQGIENLQKRLLTEDFVTKKLCRKTCIFRTPSRQTNIFKYNHQYCQITNDWLSGV